MEYEWDHKKAATNLRKHGVDFADAVTVLDDDNALTIIDPNPEEERFVTMGMDAQSRILVVVYTWRQENIRIISARKATQSERIQYEEGL
ncbi:MAG: BrnT family toxin [Acidobacteriota bacterium]|nr:MAG: BrnT family toxin [Acidobacteriota bacterium]